MLLRRVNTTPYQYLIHAKYMPTRAEYCKYLTSTLDLRQGGTQRFASDYCAAGGIAHRGVALVLRGDVAS